MKLLLNKAYINEKSWYDIYIDHAQPEAIPNDKLVFGGDIKALEELGKLSNLFPKNTRELYNLVENDGSHITSLLNNKKSTPSFQRTYTAVKFPTCYKDYNTEDQFPFENDSFSSFKSAWEKIGSPEKFVVYLELVSL